MSRVNEQGYVERKSRSGRRNPNGKTSWRNWYLIKHSLNPSSKGGYIRLDAINFPPEYVGKRIRLKIELVEEK